MTRSGYHQMRTADALTERQREVLALIAKRKTNGEIAAQLHISLDGVKWHVREILAKLGVDSREDAARIWRQEQTLGARLARRLSLAPMTIGVGAGAAALIVAVATVVAFAIGQDGNGEPPASHDDAAVAGASPTPPANSQDTPPATPPATLTPEEEDFLALARDVDAELRQGITDLLNSRAELEHVVCTDEHYPPSGVDPYPCEFIGDEFWMFVVGHGTHGVRERMVLDDPWVRSASLLLYDENAIDGFGPGYPRVIAISSGEAGGDSMSMMVTRIRPGGPGRPMNGVPGRPPSRQTSVLQWQRAGDEWRLTSLNHELQGIQAIARVMRESSRAPEDGTWHEVTSLACPTESSYYPRPDIAGQRIGPVTIRLPHLAETAGVTLRELPDGRYATDLQLFITAPEGSQVEISGAVAGTDVPAAFSHPGTSPAMEATGEARFVLDDAMYGDGTPDTVATVRGDLVTSGYGCHQVWVTAGGERYGPFGFMAWPPRR